MSEGVWLASSPSWIGFGDCSRNSLPACREHLDHHGCHGVRVGHPRRPGH